MTHLKKIAHSFYNKYLLVPHKFFLITALVFGLPILFFRPGYDVPDFNAHFKRGYDASQGNIKPDILPVASPGAKFVGGYLPKDVSTFVDVIYKRKNPARQQFKLYSTPYNNSNKAPVDYNTTAIYNPLSYSVQVIGIKIGELLRLSLYAMVFIISLLNFLMWLTAIYFAIKIIPVGKWFITVLNLLPMTLFLMPSVSTDPIMFATIFLYAAYIIRLIVNKKPVTTRQLIALLGFSLMLAIIKQTFFVLSLFIILLYKQLGPKKKALGKLFMLIVLPFILAVWWALLIRKLNFLLRPDTNPNLQISLALHHPLHILRMLLRTCLLTLDGTAWSFFGVLGWLDMPIPLWSVFLGVIVLAYSVLIERGKVVFSKLNQAFFGVMFILNILLILGALYAYWTPVGKITIEGLQGRYFIPLVVLLVPVLLSGAKLDSKKLPLNKHQLFIPVSVTIILITSSLIMMQQYYPGLFNRIV